MISESFRFHVGNFECIAVSDGSLPVPEPAYKLLFKNAPLELLRNVLDAQNIQLDQWVEVFNCLVISTGTNCVLIDTGLGIHDSAPNAGRLLRNLRDEGIEPNKIDTVIISHAHGDHIGGNTDSERRAAFPQARYYIRKEEWVFWTSKTTLNKPEHEWMTEFVNKCLLPIQDRFHFVEQDIEIVPGVKSLFAPGNTPGNLALVITSGSEQLIYFGDAILHHLNLEYPDWYGEPDCLPAQTVSTRRCLLELAAHNHALIFATHLDFPGLGYAQPQQGNWKWQPIGDTK